MNSETRFVELLSLLLPYLIVTGVIAIIWIVNDNQNISAQWDFQQELLPEQYWRFFSYAFTSINLYQALLNIGALFLLLYFFRYNLSSPYTLGAWTISIIVASYGCYLYAPSLEQYSGMSAGLHGLFLYLCLRNRLPLILPALLISKVIIEQTSTFQQSEFALAVQEALVYTPSHEMHLWGIIGGMISYLIIRTIVIIRVFIEINE